MEGLDGLAGLLGQRLFGYYNHPDLHYHNYVHAVDVCVTATELAERVERGGRFVDVEVVRCAAIAHDAGYVMEPVAQGYPTKEAHSAALAAAELVQMGCDSDFIARVQECILATEHDSTPSTVEGSIVRAADLSGLAHSFEEFSENAGLLRAEAEALRGSPILDGDWKSGVVRTVAGFLSGDIRLTGDYLDVDGVSAWHRKVVGNLDKYLAVTA